MLSNFSSILLANLAANKHPITVPTEPIRDGFNGKLAVRACPIVPDAAVNAIIKLDVPIPICNGYCIIKTRINKIMTPPPAPKIPHKIPTKKPSINPVNVTLDFKNLIIKLLLFALLSKKSSPYLISLIPLIININADNNKNTLNALPNPISGINLERKLPNCAPITEPIVIHIPCLRFILVL